MDRFLNTNFDDEFRNIQRLQWLPYLGKKYLAEKNRFLIVGESHYVPDNENHEDYLEKNWTRQFILKEGINLSEYYFNSPPNPLIRNFEKAFLNKSVITKDNKLKLWESVAYFNIVQDLLQSIKSRPDGYDYENGWNVFFEIIKIIKPSYVLFCGVEASNYSNQFCKAAQKNGFKTQGIHKELEKIGNTFPRSAKFYDNQNNCTKIIFIKHPSKYFSWNKWGDFISRKFN